MSHVEIREIQQEDNQHIANVIREVLVESGAPKVGTAYEDEALNDMFKTYSGFKCAYFVVVEDGAVVGGAGVGPLENEPETCELQKMYFLKSARGRGLGQRMMQICLGKAKTLGYKKCYLETLPYMQAATKLYTQNGFKNLEKPLGKTGHYSCNVWMIKTL
ncbi:GNAT family N-acetyltransferase [Formosa sp. A9]|uniref:GNAT family N-acetyltransferase n=1 Tax=Formosa sp. A9 TaxID=3442641 RepID=UPI003EB81F3D